MLKGFFVGVLSCLLIILSFWWMPLLAQKTETLSCHRLYRENQTQYCVYYRETPSAISRHYRLTIGRSPGRGVTYGVPFPSDRLTTRWDAETDNLTIEMPGASLTVTPAQYLDLR